MMKKGEKGVAVKVTKTDGWFEIKLGRVPVSEKSLSL